MQEYRSRNLKANLTSLNLPDQEVQQLKHHGVCALKHDGVPVLDTDGKPCHVFETQKLSKTSRQYSGRLKKIVSEVKSNYLVPNATERQNRIGDLEKCYNNVTTLGEIQSNPI